MISVRRVSVICAYFRFLYGDVVADTSSAAVCCESQKYCRLCSNFPCPCLDVSPCYSLPASLRPAYNIRSRRQCCLSLVEHVKNRVSYLMSLGVSMIM
jgi:hypothetical protein